MAASNSNLDLAFAMDCTSSMGSYITSAKNNIRVIIDEITAKEMITIRLALIEYRDHPPQDSTFVTRVHSFTNTVMEMKGWLEQCSAHGGGDGPEAVADALHDALNLSWRSDAAKICILISDAPPHGLVRAGDGFPDGCPAGHDPLNIVRKMAEKNITLYTVGVEPPIVPYRDFFMTIAHITGGQYVPMVDANRLAQMIIGGVREEISIDRVMNATKRDIAREMRKAASDGVDDIETAKRLQRVFSDKNVVVNRMKNEAGAPSKVAEECYSKCVGMSDIQQQYKQTQTVSHTKPAEMDYKLEEEKTVSLEQAKRIVQKAKNWDYSNIDEAEKNGNTPCKYGTNCHDHSEYHRARFSHPENDNLSTQRKHETKSSHHNTQHRDTHRTTQKDSNRIPCKHEERCHDHSEYHRAKYSHPENESRRTPCKHKENCHDHSVSHREAFSHPETGDHRIKCKHGSNCYDNSDYHRTKYSHPNMSS
ncbi:unnamed protein product [Rotaria sordida]|uniref:VWFA domain-containing protein n=1 Tax=Rotaria sordida TaxID=392033 RepID=A0A819ABL5_9BILA|nr:unnamed protein product [Rotaria sordida]CAF3781897.1 unnamed protein product [Rotaria sordida]